MSEPDSTANDDVTDGDKTAKPRRLMPKLGGASVGAAMAGMEAAVFRSTPPPIEIVEQNRHDGPTVTRDGTILTITMPDAIAPAEPAGSSPTDE